jgi:hypothetical protein
MVEILKRDTRAGNQAIQLCLDAFYGRAGKVCLPLGPDYAFSKRTGLYLSGACTFVPGAA